MLLKLLFFFPFQSPLFFILMFLKNAVDPQTKESIGDTLGFPSKATFKAML
jgi:hypothetical protein